MELLTEDGDDAGCNKRSHLEHNQTTNKSNTMLVQTNDLDNFCRLGFRVSRTISNYLVQNMERPLLVGFVSRHGSQFWNGRLHQ